jgi:hypothetical protein
MAAQRATTRKRKVGKAETSAIPRRQRGARWGKIDPRDPRLLALLRSLEPRPELATRYALRGMFLGNVGGDRGPSEDSAAAASSARPNRRRKATAATRTPSRHRARKHRAR